MQPVTVRLCIYTPKLTQFFHLVYPFCDENKLDFDTKFQCLEWNHALEIASNFRTNRTLLDENLMTLIGIKARTYGGRRWKNRRYRWFFLGDYRGCFFAAVFLKQFLHKFHSFDNFWVTGRYHLIRYFFAHEITQKHSASCAIR